MNEIIEDLEYFTESNDIIIDDSDAGSSIDYESDVESEFDYIVSSDLWEEIFEYENHIETPLVQGKYLIGLPGYLRNTNEWLYLSGISPQSFYKYNFDDITKYLQEFSLSYVHDPKIHIIKLDIRRDGTCNVILKTFWLKIIQRRWKQVFKAKQEYARKMGRRVNMYARELGKRFYCPSLYGMLSG